MFGLMGTLIPLAPGLLGLATGDVKTLSESLIIAFDTTILGLAVAVVGYFISKVRSSWYEDYMVLSEALMTTILEKFSDTFAGQASDDGDRS
jgi:biopolymer transport protein ExbB/TolQ